MDTKEENWVSIEQLELVLQMLPLQEEAIRKTLASMQESSKAHLPTSNWKSSGLTAMRLLQRFTTGIAGMIETGKAELLMRKLEEMQPIEEKQVPELNPNEAVAKHPRKSQSAKGESPTDTNEKPKRKAPRK